MNPEHCTPAEAERLICSHLTCLPIESLPVAHCAGAVLRENVYAERDQPPFDRVSMDGIAVNSAGALRQQRRLQVQAGMQAAGTPQLALQSSAHCIEAMTGAMLPSGCDAVVPVERIRLEHGVAHIAADFELTPHSNVHRRASDQKQGALQLSAGMMLHAPEVAVAAAAGMARLRVSAQPSIIVISTGDELIEPGEPIAPHQIRRSNAYGVAAALRERGFARVADDHLPDDATRLGERLAVHLATHDVLILSGGVSMGRFDFLPTVLPSLGVNCMVHGVLQRPGRPLWFGTTTEGRTVFALPGNPVSTLVCLARYVLPALYVAMGMQHAPAEKIALAAPLEWAPKLTGFMPVRINHDDWGRPWATPCPTHGSGDYAALALTDGFVELPPGPAALAKGHVTRLYRW